MEFWRVQSQELGQACQGGTWGSKGVSLPRTGSQAWQWELGGLKGPPPQGQPARLGSRSLGVQELVGPWTPGRNLGQDSETANFDSAPAPSSRLGQADPNADVGRRTSDTCLVWRLEKVKLYSLTGVFV